MAHGIDVSNNNGAVDYSGVAFLFHKATEGVGFVDKTQQGFVDEAKTRGIHHGPYHFAHPDANSADAEAAFFLAHAIPGDFWSLDCETRKDTNPLAIMGADRLTAWCDRFYDLVAPTLGVGYHYTFRSYADALWPRLGRPWRWWLASAAGAPKYRTYATRTVDVEQYAIVGGVDQNESYTTLTGEPDMPLDASDKAYLEQMVQGKLEAVLKEFGFDADSGKTLRDLKSAGPAGAATKLPVKGGTVTIEY